jgi:hypothetical protein
VCKCALYYCHRVAIQLQLNIYHIVSQNIEPSPRITLYTQIYATTKVWFHYVQHGLHQHWVGRSKTCISHNSSEQLDIPSMPSMSGWCRTARWSGANQWTIRQDINRHQAENTARHESSENNSPGNKVNNKQDFRKHNYVLFKKLKRYLCWLKLPFLFSLLNTAVYLV